MNVLFIREKMGYSVAEFANMINISTSSMYRHQKKPSVRIKKKILDALVNLSVAIKSDHFFKLYLESIKGNRL